MSNVYGFQPGVEAIDECNWLLRFGNSISEECAERVRLAEQLAAKGLGQQLYDLVPAYTTLLLSFREPAADRRHLRHVLDALVEEVLQAELQSTTGNLVQLPVYYGRDVALDWQEVEQQTGMDFEQVCILHQQQVYRVYAIGFAPGFAYLGTTPEAIRVRRKVTPRLAVPQGSLALADNQTAIYPAASPGGWQIIGRSPMQMIDWQSEALMPVRTGDQVQFESINRAEFLRLGGRVGEA